ncbi:MULTISPECIES: hypothetical protein [Vibrio]|nr:MULTISPECIES: hypothetical protein [Vibrio]NRF63702.1 hypothetical protein [Vibrio coralliilyticus]
MDNYLDIWLSVTQIIFILCLLLLFWFGCMSKGKECISVFVGMVLIVIVSDTLLRQQIRTVLTEKISDYSFVIESDVDFDESKLLDAIKNKKYVTLYRTKPLTKNKVRIVVNNGEVELLIAEDSKNDNTFWVYYPKYRYSRVNAIGKVRIR